jgi:hypothetical protein
MKNELLKLIENSKNYTLSVAQTMPEDMYSFKPTDDVWDFNELLQHIAYGISWWEENYIKMNRIDWSPAVLNVGKQDIIKNITEAYDSLKKTVEVMKLSDIALKGFYATLDHITHHRGQAILYLRCKGMVPPEYSY